MRRILFVLASVIAVLSFSCDTTDPSFEDAVPEVYHLTTNVSPEEAGTISPGEGEYVSGSSLEIEAIPEDGYIFESWGGDLSGTLNPVYLTMNQNRSVTAFFTEIDYPINIEIIGEGTVHQEVVSQTIEQIETDPEKSKPAARVKPLNPEKQNQPDPTIKPAERENRELPEQQNTQLNRSVEVDSNSEAGTTTSNVTSKVMNVTLRLTAEPEEGWEFSRWEGDLTGSENPDTIFVDSEKNVTAVFEEEVQEFTLDILTEGEGEVEIEPDMEIYEPGDEVTLTAIANTGWNFGRWDDDLSSRENPVTITMDGDKEITSVFVLAKSWNMEIDQEPTSATAGAPISPAPSVILMNGRGQPMEGIQVNAEVDTHDFSSASTTEETTNEDGIAIFENLILETAASNYRINFDADAFGFQDVTSSAFSVTAAEADPENTTAEVADGTSGVPTTISIVVQDAFGNPVSDADDELSVEVKGANTATISASETTSAGTYSAEYTPLNSGTDEIEIELNDTPISGSPFTSEVTSSGISPSVSSVSADPVQLQVGSGSLLTIDVRDDENNPVSGLADEIVISGLEGAEAGTVTEEENSGIYSTEITSTTPGQITVTTEIAGVILDDTPVITFLTGDPDKIEIVSGDNQTGQISETLENPFVVRVSDSFDNPVEGIQISFEIDQTPSGADGQQLSTTSSETDPDGQASSTLTLGTATGTYTVEVSSNVGSVDFSAEAFGGAATEFDFEPISNPQVAGTPFEITINALDSEGNPAGGYNGTAGLSVASGSISPSSVSFDGGQAVQNVSVMEAGSNQSITAADGSITGTSNEFDVETGGPSQGEITQQPTETIAGETISPAPAVEILDDQDNPVEGVNITAELNGGSFSSGSTLQAETNSSGIAEFSELSAETAESYTITFDVEAPAVSDLTTNTFEVVAAEGDPDNSIAEVFDGAAGQENTISILVKDAFGNPVGGVANNLDITVNGANSANPSASETDTDGEYSASYTPVITGTDNIEIELNGSPISGSPYSSEVSVTTISGSGSSVEADPTELQTGNSSIVTADVRDAVGNPISNLSDSDFNIDVSGNGSAGSVSETSSAGRYEFSVSNTTAQEITVTVIVKGVKLDDTPQITFTAAAADIMLITVEPEETIAGEPIEGPPTVRLTDQFNNTVSGVEVTVSEQGGQTFTNGTLTVNSNSSGNAVFDDLEFIGADRYNLVFTASGVTNRTSNSFNIIPAAADPGETTASVPNGSAGDQTDISITVRDAFENRVEGVGGDLSVSISGANSGAGLAAVSDEGDGVYTTSYTPTTTGSDQVTIELNGDEIQGSPFSSEVITSDADEIVIEQQPQQTTAGEAINGPPSVSVSDDLGNPVEGIEVNVSIQGSASLDGGTTSRTTDNNGIAEFNNLVVETAGNYTLEFNAVGVSDNAVSDIFNVTDANAENLVRESGNNQSAAVTETLDDPFVVEVTDEFDNPVEGFDVEFSILSVPAGASGQQLSNATVSTDADGLASTVLTLGTLAGTYEVNADAGPAGSLIFTAEADAGAATEFVFDEISSPQTAGESFGTQISALDDQGNIAGNYGGTANLTTTAGSINPTSASFNNGTASLDVQVSTAGTNETITASDGSVTGTSNTFNVQSGGVNAGNSSVSANPDQLTASETSTLTIELRDGSDNPVSGLDNSDFSISVSGGSGSAGTVVETGPSGTYESSVTNNTAEQVTVTVTADGVALDDTPSITFEAADADDIEIISGNNQTGSVTQQLDDPFVVKVSDQFENPVENETVTFAIIQTPGGANGQSLSETSLQTNAAGLASSELTFGDAPGTYRTVASAGSAGNVTFEAEAEIGEASQMAVTTQPDQTTAGDIISPAPAVKVTDDAGNTVEGVEVAVSEQSGATFDSGTLTQNTNSSGIAEFDDLLFESADTYTLVFGADGVTEVTSDQFEVTVDAGDPANTTAHVPNGTAGEQTTITIDVLDQFDNPVSGVDDDLSITITGANTTSPSVLENGSPGEYTATYTPNNSGTDNVTITLNGTHISGSPFTSEVATSGISASESSAEANPATLQAGNSSTVTVELRDAVGNAIGGLSDSDFNVSEDGDGTIGSVSEISTGTYEFSVYNETAQQVTVTITADGVELDDSPAMTFEAADPDEMTIENQPLNSDAGEPIGGPPGVEIVDQFGNKVPGINVTVSEQGGQSFESGTTEVSTGSNGIAEFDDLVIIDPGDYNLVFTASGVTNQTSNEFNVTHADASEIDISSGNIQTGTVTQQLDEPFVVVVTDDFGNPVEGETVTFAIDQTPGGASGQSLSETSVQTNSAGQASSLLTLGSRSGSYEVTASVGGLDSETFFATAEPGEAAEFEFETISGSQVAGTPFSITLTARDNQGNVAEGYQGTADLSTDTGNITPTTVSFTDGTAALDVTLDETGTDRTLTASDGSITGTSNSFDVQSGGVDAGNSSVSADPEQLTAGDNSTLTIELRDGSDNPVSGLEDSDFTISVSGSSGSGSSENLTETGISGTYTVDISHTVAEQVTVSVEADEVALDDTPTITFEAADPDEMTIENQPLDSDAGEAIGGPPGVKIVDQFGNNVPGVDVSVSLNSNDFTAGSTPPVVTDADGIASFDDLIIEEAGTGYIITFEADAPGVSDVTSDQFDVIAGDVSASESSVTASPNELETGNSSEVTIVLEDDNNNSITGLTDGDFTVDVTGNGSGGTVTETGTPGTYTVNITNNTAEEVTVTITADGVELDNQPVITFTAEDT